MKSSVQSGMKFGGQPLGARDSGLAATSAVATVVAVGGLHVVVAAALVGIQDGIKNAAESQSLQHTAFLLRRGRLGVLQEVGTFLRACTANIARLEASVAADSSPAASRQINATAAAHRHGVVRNFRQPYAL